MSIFVIILSTYFFFFPLSVYFCFFSALSLFFPLPDISILFHLHCIMSNFVIILLFIYFYVPLCCHSLLTYFHSQYFPQHHLPTFLHLGVAPLPLPQLTASPFTLAAVGEKRRMTQGTVSYGQAKSKAMDPVKVMEGTTMACVLPLLTVSHAPQHQFSPKLAY